LHVGNDLVLEPPEESSPRATIADVVDRENRAAGASNYYI